MDDLRIVLGAGVAETSLGLYGSLVLLGGAGLRAAREAGGEVSGPAVQPGGADVNGRAGYFGDGTAVAS